MMEPRGFGAVALMSDATIRTAMFKSYCAKRKQFASSPLGSLSYETQPLQQEMLPSVASNCTPAAGRANCRSDIGMVHIKGGNFKFVVHGVQVEGSGGLAGPDDRSQPDVMFPWCATNHYLEIECMCGNCARL
jgi:hypothetical protein